MGRIKLPVLYVCHEYWRCRVDAVICCLLRSKVLVLPAPRSTGCPWSTVLPSPRHCPWCKSISCLGMYFQRAARPQRRDDVEVQSLVCAWNWNNSQGPFLLQDFLWDQPLPLHVIQRLTLSTLLLSLPQTLVNLKISVSESDSNLRENG